ncbi:MAG TPA: 5-bromo-4-chloroindolyl phosphate hydrolysis family protein, partial [Candidatus Blautia gallistercoris]|nr:5-bromo-4-chloroindolyl phosphate hydrolysis family protein [Candidatus Blautia gallistercoris]
DTAVKQNAEVLFGTGTRILSYLQENPDKIKLARRFFNYYLDMAAKLLSRYIKFQNTGVKSPEVLEILEKTAKALPVLNTAFEKQFTHLMEGELLDVEADIELLKSTLEMEGGK